MNLYFIDIDKCPFFKNKLSIIKEWEFFIQLKTKKIIYTDF